MGRPAILPANAVEFPSPKGIENASDLAHLPQAPEGFPPTPGVPGDIPTVAMENFGAGFHGNGIEEGEEIDLPDPFDFFS